MKLLWPLSFTLLFTLCACMLFFATKPTPIPLFIQRRSNENEKSSTIEDSLSLSRYPRCGTWQKDYIALHQKILNGTLPARYLVSVAVEGGLTDRLTGTLTEFFLAFFTQRAFQIITYGTLPRFEAAFLAPNINWSRPTDPDHLINNLKYTYRGVRGYSGDRSYDSTVNTSLYWPLFMVNDDRKHEFYRSSNVSQYPPGHENVTTLFIVSNRGRIVQLFDNPYHRSQLGSAKCYGISLFHFLYLSFSL